MKFRVHLVVHWDRAAFENILQHTLDELEHPENVEIQYQPMRYGESGRHHNALVIERWTEGE